MRGCGLKIAIFLFDGVTALDPISVYDPLARLPNTEITFVTETGHPCRTGDGFLSLVPAASIEALSDADILLLPGGSTEGLRRYMTSELVRSNIVRLDQQTSITASVCTGSLILGSAGLLRGRKASTNWRAKDYLARFGAEYTGERVTRSDKYWTSAGVTAGIDLGLALCAYLAGDEVAAAVELAMEYDPVPPFGGGNPGEAPIERQRIVADVLRS